MFAVSISLAQHSPIISGSGVGIRVQKLGRKKFPVLGSTEYFLIIWQERKIPVNTTLQKKLSLVASIKNAKSKWINCSRKSF